jgi:hypothetical protein
MSISEHDETGENVKRHPDTELRVVVPKDMLNGTIATRIELIRRSIIHLTNDISTKKDSDKAWSTISKSMSYLSAKDTMIKYCEENNHVV